MSQFQSVFVRGSGVFLPGEPVGNDQMEDVLGVIGGKRSRARRKILKSNGITSRHYAVDRHTGRPTHTNAQLTAEAVRKLTAQGGFDLDLVDCIASGTSTPDQMMPNHAAMVHGELGCRPCEVMASTGACLSGLSALKYAALTLETAGGQNAVATGSELASGVMKASHFPDGESAVELLDEDPVFAFQQDFLRWMLSDGAGALWLSREAGSPSESLTLQLNWIENISFAGDMETCMSWGGRKQDGGAFQGWLQSDSIDDAVRQGMMNFTQDARLLGREVVPQVVERALPMVFERRDLAPGDVDWFLPHYSSEYFHDPIHAGLERIGFPLEERKWASNLTSKGNTGSASIYIMLDELMRSGKLERGQRILGFVPESARFSVGYVLFTVI